MNQNRIAQRVRKTSELLAELRLRKATMYDSHDWSHEAGPVERVKCKCCGEPMRMVCGSVCDGHGEDIAFYIANLTPHRGPRSVRMLVGLLDVDGRKTNPKTEVFELRMQDDEVMVSPCANADDSLPHDMSSKQGFVDHSKSRTLAIVDFVLEKDCRIRPFLEREKRSA